MGRMKPKNKVVNDVLLFDILYEDDSRSSNRKVPQSALDGHGKEEDQVRHFIEAQDRELGALSGNPRARVKSVSRSPARG